VAADDQTKTGAGNLAAIALAKKSPMVSSSFAFLLSQAARIKDATLRKETLDALGNPHTCIQHRANVTDAQKSAIPANADQRQPVESSGFRGHSGWRKRRRLSGGDGEWPCGQFGVCSADHSKSSSIEPELTAQSRRMSDMQETAQQYVQRILGHAEGHDPLRVQATTPNKLDRLTKGVPSSKLRKRPAPDKWSVVEILAHLGDAEIVVAWRIRSILGAPGTPLQAYDQNAWVAAGHYAKRDPRECLEQFRAVRKGNLALLKSLTPEQWKNHGMHAERGQETIEHIVRLMAGHDLNHLQQVERILDTKK
jgi:hypothetical protein